jgi:transcription elongation factor GreA
MTTITLLPADGAGGPASAGRRSERRPAGPAALTREGRRQLAEQAHHLRYVQLPALRPLLVAWERDERDVEEFARAEAELARLEGLLAEADDIAPVRRKPRRDRATVRLGSRVVVETPDLARETVRIVHPDEAALDDERITATSPLADALIGAKVGDVVWVLAPAGAWPARVVDVLGDPRPWS